MSLKKENKSVVLLPYAICKGKTSFKFIKGKQLNNNNICKITIRRVGMGIKNQFPVVQVLPNDIHHTFVYLIP